MYHVIIGNIHVSAFTYTISHVHGRAPKRNVMRKKLQFMKACKDTSELFCKIMEALWRMTKME